MSTQAVRNYEADGILPVSERTPHGYRVYTPLHASALRAFLALIPGHGHRMASAIMVSINLGDDDEAYRLVDEGHAQLLADRRTLTSVRQALTQMDSRALAPAATMFIGPLAHRIGVDPATVRSWEAAGLVRPGRDPQTGYRIYSPDDIRDVDMIRQLRRGGYPLERIAFLLDEIRAAGGVDQVAGLLDDWRSRLTSRGRSMITGAAALEKYLLECEATRGARD